MSSVGALANRLKGTGRLYYSMYIRAGVRNKRGVEETRPDVVIGSPQPDIVFPAGQYPSLGIMARALAGPQSLQATR